MGMDPVTIGLIVAAASAAMSASAAQQQAKAQSRIARENAQAQVNELARQQYDINEKANEQKSDRIREAERELAAVRVASAEGFAMGDRVTGEIGYNEGLDLSRIEASRANQEEANISRMTAAAKGSIDQASIANMQAEHAQQSAFIGLIGSGVSIVGADYNRTLDRAAKSNTTAPTFSQYASQKWG